MAKTFPASTSDSDGKQMKTEAKSISALWVYDTACIDQLACVVPDFANHLLVTPHLNTSLFAFF